MKHYVYLIINQGKKKLTTYVGYTNNIQKRLKLHNTSKGAKFTKGRYWEIVYKKEYNTKKEAMINEYKLKKNKIKRNVLKNIYKLKNNIKL
jgi:putative endonuclease|tara:strand:+ start:1856 stop:2128 length:273 start_codon:yes stop_codon:yes gene_type:complete